MAATAQETGGSTEGPGWFKTTHWSLVRQAGSGDSPEAGAALASLCQVYWYPLYVFVRRQGQQREDAQDLVQGFFAKLVEKNYLQGLDRDKGRFRSFLLVALKRYMANEWDRMNRQRRGGGRQVISLDAAETEHRFLAEPMDEFSPERAYERQWATTLLGQVLGRLEGEYGASGKNELFFELKGLLSGERAAGGYAELGGRIGMSEGGVKTAVHRIRRRYRELLRLEIANTLLDSAEIDEEIRYLFANFA
jgi:RNA polymerase sigma-70 factor (ECF subfamily)